MILFGYPAITVTMNYLNPATERAIESRVGQVYLPALLMQSMVLLVIFWVILRWPINPVAGKPLTASAFTSLGLGRKDISWANLAVGVIFLLVAIIILNVVSNIINYYGVFETKDITYLLPRTTLEKMVWVILSISAGVTEEISFRGFVITRTTMLTGSVWPGMLLGSLSFGAGHLYQGVGGATVITIYGLLFALLFVARGSLMPCIIAHALQDILALLGV